MRKHNPYITIPLPDPDAVSGDWTPLSSSIEDVVKIMIPTIDYKKAFELLAEKTTFIGSQSRREKFFSEIINQCTKSGE